MAESAFSLLWSIEEFVSVSTRNSDSHIQAIQAVDLITSNSHRWLFLKLLCMCVYLESMLFCCRSLHFLYLEYQTLASVPLGFQTQIFNLESHWSNLHLMDLLFLELFFFVYDEKCCALLWCRRDIGRNIQGRQYLSWSLYCTWGLTESAEKILLKMHLASSSYPVPYMWGLTEESVEKILLTMCLASSITIFHFQGTLCE